MVLTDKEVRGALGGAVDLHRLPDAAAAVGARRRVRDPAGVQPRRRAAVRDHQLQRRPGIAGHRLPQRHRRAVHGRAGASRCACACWTSTASRRRPSFLVRDDAARIYPNIAKRLAPDFFFQPQVYRADGETIRSSGRRLHRRRVARSGIPAADQARVDVRTAGDARPPGALDRSVARRLVFGRSSHPLVRLLPLRKPDRGRAAEGHVAADRRRGAERRERADVGAVLLPSEAVLQRRGSPAVEAGTPHALRPRDLRLPLEPRRPSRPARAEGSGLPRHEAAGGLADLDVAGAALGEEAGLGRRASRTRDGASRSAARIFPTTRCRASTASAPTSSSSTSRIRTRWISFPPATRRTSGS